MCGTAAARGCSAGPAPGLASGPVGGGVFVLDGSAEGEARGEPVRSRFAERGGTKSCGGGSSGSATVDAISPAEAATQARTTRTGRPTVSAGRARKSKRILRATSRSREEEPALVSHVTSCRLLCCCALVCALGTVCAGGGDREDVALSYVYANQLRVCGSQLAVCLVSLFVSVSVAHACRHHLSSVHPYRVGVQSEPGCSSPSYLTPNLTGLA